MMYGVHFIITRFQKKKKKKKERAAAQGCLALILSSEIEIGLSHLMRSSPVHALNHSFTLNNIFLRVARHFCDERNYGFK